MYLSLRSSEANSSFKQYRRLLGRFTPRNDVLELPLYITLALCHFPALFQLQLLHLAYLHILKKQNYASGAYFS